jgi:hypothetical protein
LGEKRKEKRIIGANLEIIKMIVEKAAPEFELTLENKQLERRDM